MKDIPKSGTYPKSLHMSLHMSILIFLLGFVQAHMGNHAHVPFKRMWLAKSSAFTPRLKQFTQTFLSEECLNPT